MKILLATVLAFLVSGSVLAAEEIEICTKEPTLNWSVPQDMAAHKLMCDAACDAVEKQGGLAIKVLFDDEFTFSDATLSIFSGMALTKKDLDSPDVRKSDLAKAKETFQHCQTVVAKP